MDLKEKIRTIPDFPKPGIMFRDITTLIEDYDAFEETIKRLFTIAEKYDIDKIAGIESRGFIFGTPLALKLKKGFVLIRKKGKLPGKTISQEYDLEYGKDKIEIHTNSIEEGDKVLLIDDLIATGGSMRAACELVEKAGGNVAAILFVVELPDLHGRDKLKDYDVRSLVSFAGE
ncbi:adenine phosphoribosyltransferase [Candidatus Woesearchaeota archaeon]|nr:adenine phosphoribosyltransferase [Candidatus Woesearchaeota archaeon]